MWIKWPETDLCPGFWDKNPKGGWGALPLNFSPSLPTYPPPPSPHRSPQPVKTNEWRAGVLLLFQSSCPPG